MPQSRSLQSAGVKEPVSGLIRCVGWPSRPSIFSGPYHFAVCRRTLASLDPASALMPSYKPTPLRCRMRGSFLLVGLAMSAPDKVGARGGVEDFTRNAWLSQAFVNL